MPHGLPGVGRKHRELGDEAPVVDLEGAQLFLRQFLHDAYFGEERGLHLAGIDQRDANVVRAQLGPPALGHSTQGELAAGIRARVLAAVQAAG